MTSTTKIITRPLGKDGPEVPRLGLGFVGLSGSYGHSGSDEDRLAFLDNVYKTGEVFWDVGECTSIIVVKQQLD
jgi:aryl-alcohol dehydrogenase-like predicted oxidoreductase